MKQVKASPKPIKTSPKLPQWETFVATKLQDLSVSLVVSSKETNFAELSKIGGSFATTYRVPRYNISYQSPNKMRVEAKVLLLSPLLIYNGDQKYSKIGPKAGKENVRGEAGKKQSLMDVGIFTKDWLTTDYEPQFLRKEGNLLVYKLQKRFSDNKAHEIIWLNPTNSIIERRQSIGWEKELLKEIRYKTPQLINGVWIPTRVEIYNQFGKLGAVQTVERITVNTNLPSSLFAIP
jgi:hypothetical protein